MHFNSTFSGERNYHNPSEHLRRIHVCFTVASGDRVTQLLPALGRASEGHVQPVSPFPGSSRTEEPVSISAALQGARAAALGGPCRSLPAEDTLFTLCSSQTNREAAPHHRRTSSSQRTPQDSGAQPAPRRGRCLLAVEHRTDTSLPKSPKADRMQRKLPPSQRSRC